MKYLKAYFKGYIGFFNGMGVEEISIDFTRCMHNIILIIGKNGSGKSTLLNHLNPFPDGSSSFIPGKNAEKRLVLMNDGDTYEITITSPADLKGRKTTKAFVRKNGLELNENGNVSSYKEIIFSEFELDSNYIALSKLSGDDRGLGDKTPSERKRFVSNIIDNLEIYNNMYKAFNKKSLIFKSHINTLHTKIQNIGDKGLLEQRLKNLQSMESDINSKILGNNNQIVAIQAKTSIDPEEAEKITLANTKSSQLKSQLDLASIELDKYEHRTKITRSSIRSTVEENSNLINVYTSKTNELLSLWKEQNSRISDIDTNIKSIEAELKANESISNDDISKRYDDSKAKIENMKSELYSISPEFSVDSTVIIHSVLSFSDKFISMVDHFYDNLLTSDVEFMVNTYHKNFIAEKIAEQNSILSIIEEKKIKLAEIQSIIKSFAILDNRPKNCKIDSCHFISSALDIKKNYKSDPISDLESLQSEILTLTESSSEIQNIIDYTNSMLSKIMELDAIRRLVFDYKDNISKIYPGFIETYEKRLSELNPFNDIRDDRNLFNAYNITMMLSSEIQNFTLLEVEYKGYREKVSLLNSSRKLLENLKTEQSNLISEAKAVKIELDSYNSLYKALSDNIAIQKQYISQLEIYENIEKDFNEVNSVLDEYNKKSAKSLEMVSVIDNLNREIAEYQAKLKPISDEISSIKGCLTLLDQYYVEYNEYSEKFKYIEVLKKYCSPTGGGIQTIFMQLYMGKTKELANQVLSLLFNGNYRLLDFVINNTEFRIPFVGEGLPVDDISSGSSSQISMMSMIINLVLLHQASTKFNIARLDEIDGSADSRNRENFINVLFYTMKILEIDQMFLISHSVEADNSFADIIKFKGYDDYESGIQSGNIIFDYSKDLDTYN